MLRKALFTSSALLMTLVLALGACPLCPDGVEGPHNCCHRNSHPSCGGHGNPSSGQEQCPSQHHIYADYGKSQTIAPEIAVDAHSALSALPAAAAISAEVTHSLGESPTAIHSPPRLFLLNSVLLI